ncbi:GNAT family N-acetyltransferase [Cohnella endophytica]|uniref:GNAT family N-acetyltransferase n=1 Tax=Cohnella endophytica TaxID=2419778 RepID=A0A494Y5M6_9BACL|nr:GNAT family N-acetyltransferase [Cohnella endophytica]RKP57997.1 GNAT family N-acetyltransferase [Cohnella endophytica]
MILFENNDIALRRLEPEDAALLAKWLSDPTVLEYYEGRDNPHDIEKVRSHYYVERDEITQCIIQYKATDIGYLQFYLIENDEVELYGYQDYTGRIYGMDQFIGETRYWNQGIGSILIMITLRYLIEKKAASKIVMDPQAWNARALRVYEKNGFIKKKYLEQHELHEGELRDCWLIEYEVIDA